MSIHVKLSSTLRGFVPGYEPVKGMNVQASGQTAEGLAGDLGIPLSEIKFAMINGRHLPLDTPLARGDRVAYFPAVGGG